MRAPSQMERDVAISLRARAMENSLQAYLNGEISLQDCIDALDAVDLRLTELVNFKAPVQPANRTGLGYGENVGKPLTPLEEAKMFDKLGGAVVDTS